MGVGLSILTAAGSVSKSCLQKETILVLGLALRRSGVDCNARGANYVLGGAELRVAASASTFLCTVSPFLETHTPPAVTVASSIHYWP